MSGKNKPNILLIQVDQCSAESLGIFGNPLVRTPALESLAEKGVVFQSAYCNYPACAPSRSSMFTGRYCSALGIHANHMVLNPRETTLAHVLRGGGYSTALIGKNHAFEDGKRDGPTHRENDELHCLFDYVVEGGHTGMVEGYEEDTEVQEASRWAADHCWRPPIPYGTNPARKEKMGTWLLGDEAVKYLEARPSEEEPFFLWLSFPDPHTPYQTCEPYASLYNPDDVPLPGKDNPVEKTERQRVANIMDAIETADDDHLRRVRATHYGMINMIDDTLARVFDTLRETGLEEDTLVVFTADHGDSMGAHGFVQKLNIFYDSFCRLPLIFSWPGRIPPAEQFDPAELLDVMPTLLEFAGLEIPFGVQGKSMVPWLTGKADAHKEFIVMESGEEGCHPRAGELPFHPKDVWDGSHFVWCAYREAWLGRGRSIRMGEWKLNLYADEEGELYNLKDDPGELKNLIHRESCRDIISGLKEKLFYWMMGSFDPLPENRTVKLNFETGA